MKRYIPQAKWIYFLAASCSLSLSLWFATTIQIINPDGICYALSAEALAHGATLSQAMQVCSQAAWPFYSILIYGLSVVTHLSIEHAAYLLDALFSCATVLLFIRVVAQMGGKSILWLAAITILCAHDFNGARQYLIRDHGFWTFYLVSISALLSFVERPKWLTAILWNVSMIMAFLFRLEAAIFLMVVPFISFVLPYKSWQQRISYFLQLNLISLLASIGIIFIVCFKGQYNLSHLGRIHDLIAEFQNSFSFISTRFVKAKEIISQQVINVYGKGDAALVLGLTLASWYVVSVMKSLSWGYSLLLLFGFKNRKRVLPTPQSLALAFYIVINIIITLMFLLEAYFISRRYLLALSLVLMLFIPFAIQALYQAREDLRHKLFFAVIVLLFIASTVGGINSFGYSKSYVRDAGEWMQMHLKANESIYINDLQLLYYAEANHANFFQTYNNYNAVDLLQHQTWKKYDYLALRISGHPTAKETQLLAQINVPSIQVFKNKRNDRVIIYQIKREKVS